MNKPKPENELNKPTFWQSVASVLSAMFGVQSSKNRERDFQQGDPSTFIIVGIICVVILLIVVYNIVQTVIANAS